MDLSIAFHIRDGLKPAMASQIGWAAFGKGRNSGLGVKWVFGKGINSDLGVKSAVGSPGAPAGWGSAFGSVFPSETC